MKIEEAIQLGRRLREGTLAGEAASVSDADSVEKAALAALDSVDPAQLEAAVTARDAAESLLVLLGAVGAVLAERRVATRVAEVDARMLAVRDEWSGEAITATDPWLRRMAELDASAWWLDVVALAGLRERARAFDPAFAFRDGPRPAAMKLRRAGTSGSLRLHAEVVGMDDDPARVAIERGAVIARLFDGEVEVYAVGLRPDQDDLPAGLCVRRRGGGVAGITHVALGGVVGGQGQSGWWATLADKGPTQLTVRFGEAEEALALEIDS